MESPLLALPAEIRNKIFALALGGHEITITAGHKSFDKKTRLYTYVLTQTALPLSGVISGFVKPTFQLPRVSRQVYAETAILPYSLNTFKFTGHVNKRVGKHRGLGYCAMDCWLDHRIPAQIKAIASLVVDDQYFYRYSEGRRPAFKNRFPALQTLIVDLARPISLDLFMQLVFPKVAYTEREGKFSVEWRVDDTVFHGLATE